MKYDMKKILVTAVLSIPALAFAHPDNGDGGMLAGIFHPVSGLDHILAMLAVGLWAVSFNGKTRWVIPITFVGMMVLGFFLGNYGIYVTAMEQGIAASVLVIGLAAAWVKHIPTIIAIVVVGIFAIFHGAAHSIEMVGNINSFLLGFSISTVLLHAVGFFIGSAFHQNVWINRTIGTAIGSVGLYLLLA
ncbi:hypothetical protein PL75_01630 [Neisseria arctica]|uniref:Urease accessory protein n=1 Tax=Neisseria arctica TaxID=1470200 RepID=A0A0J0YU64_9NEIS|nr:HupE/UreJ family protein [Neisseria arctica]KLT73672.1 hypothetical protein PL75_01630 [Neisseria arctica]UOO85805.1 HupE/UreJ family protein [Neisseria arctica]